MSQVSNNDVYLAFHRALKQETLYWKAFFLLDIPEDFDCRRMAGKKNSDNQMTLAPGF